MRKEAESAKGAVDVPNAALAYAARGWAVLPCRARGKPPLTAHGVLDATRDEATIRGWWSKWPSANVGIACGSASGGLVVLDVDRAEMLWQLEKTYGALPRTRRIRTGKGTHHYFLSPEPIRTQQLVPGLEMRGESACVVAPPSIHPNGKRYEVLDDVDPVPLPDTLRHLLTEPPSSTTLPAPNAADPTIEKIREGARNSTLTSLAGTMRRRGMTAEAIEAALLAENSARCDPPLPESEVKKIARSVARYPALKTTKQKLVAMSAPSPAAAPMPTQSTTPALTPEQARATLPDLLFEIGGFLSSHLAISTAQTYVLAAWVFHTHTVAAADRTPYLHVSSPEKRTGKTLLLEVLALLVYKAWFTSNATSAALARKIAEQKPTVLLDEADTMLAGEGERIETLRGILNAGYARGGTFTRCVGEGSRQTPTDFEVFTPKAIAGLRDLPETIKDRSIPIRMKRALPGEIRKRFYRREVEPLAAALKARIELCSAALIPILKEARPERVPELHDRANDICEPLLAIADLVGDGWPEYLRLYLRELFAPEEEAEQSLGIRLLADLQEIFNQRDIDRLPSADLIVALRDRPESPWLEWRAKGLTGHGLARLLRGFRVQPSQWRDAAKIVRGYRRADFLDCWARYLPASSSQKGVEVVQTVQPAESTS